MNATVVVLGLFILAWVLNFTEYAGLENMRWFRRRLGGDWGRVTGFWWGRRWIRFPCESLGEQVEERYWGR